VTLLSLFAPGDANGDQFVDRADAAILARNLGMTTGALWSHGDFDYNQRVDLLDLALLQANFGQGPVGPNSSPIPEPSTFALAASVAVGLVVLRVRRWRPRAEVTAS
jgi:hypothetical protein